MSIVQNIVNLIEENNISKNKLAVQTGISSGLIGDWVAGRKEPSLKNAIKIAEYFKVSLDFLVGRENEHGSPISNLSDNDSDILEILHQFGERDQTKFIGKVEQLAKEYEKEVTERNFAKKEKFT